jgi:nitrite reductase/ring-hydroxylating ferredoxin subunit
MGNSCEVIYIKEGAGVVWVWDILGDPTEGGVVINTACPHLEFYQELSVQSEKFIPCPVHR